MEELARMISELSNHSGREGYGILYLVYCLIDIYHNNMVFYAVFWYTKRNGGEFIWQERKSIMLSSPIRNIKS